MKPLSVFLLLLPLMAQTPPSPAIHYIRPGEDPQAALDSAKAGETLVFLPGMHVNPLRKHRALLYVDKPMSIELMEGAVLKLADHQTVLLKDPEITTDHGPHKTIDDLSMGGDYDLGLGPTIFTIKIDGSGSNGAPDTFSWGSGELFNVRQQKVPITGDWQLLSNGVRLRFANTTGHSLGSLWFISYDGLESYGIRIGYGRQKEYIENVHIFGKGTLDLNSPNNVEPSPMVKNISACVLVHGRVRDVEIEGITMTNTMRSVMLYGEHTGRFLEGGPTGPGESFDAENISIHHTRTINPNGAAYLLGHPSHRGRLNKVRCNFNYMETATTSLEPNFNLDQYEVIGNVIKSGGRAIHCWRRSTNGLIADNVRIDDTTGKEVVMINAPASWRNPENIVLRDNRNHLSDPVGYWANVSGGFENRAEGRFATVSGGQRNHARGLASSVTGGSGNEAVADYSRAQGLGARAVRPAEDTLASGFFQSAGDAQSSLLVARHLTTDAAPGNLELAGNRPIEIAENSSVTYRILVVARSENGRDQAAFEATGLATRSGGAPLVLGGAKVATIHKSSPSFAFEVTAGNGGKELVLQARGIAGVPIRWVARVELAEVAF
jgi:hypothetical protein